MGNKYWAGVKSREQPETNEDTAGGIGALLSSMIAGQDSATKCEVTYFHQDKICASLLVYGAI